MAAYTQPSPPSPSGTGTTVPHQRFISVTVFALIAAVYLSTLFSLYPGLPIIERAAETIPGFSDHYPPFRTDENTYFAITREILDGSIYSQDSPARRFPAGYPLVAAPFVALDGERGMYLANLVLVFISLVLFYHLLRRHAPQVTSLALTLVLAFCSPDWFYAISAYSEPLAQVLILSTLLLITGGASDRSFYRHLIAGLFCGLVLFVRPHAAIITAPFLWFLAGTNERRIALTPSLWRFSAGLAGAIVLWMLRNAIVFGSPLAFEYSGLIGAFSPGMDSSYMKGNIFLGIHRLFFDQYHGLFTITPVILLFPAGIAAMWRKGLQREATAILSAVLLIAFIAAAGPYPFTEFGLGSRHLMPIWPLLLYPMVFFLDGRAFARWMTILLAAYSFYHAGIGWFTGGEPGMGFYLGILNDGQSRAILLARNSMLPKKEFASRDQLLRHYRQAIRRANLYLFLQTLSAEDVRRLAGNERAFLLYLRSQPDPTVFIDEADPASGIIHQSFTIGPVDSIGMNPSSY